MDYIDQLHAWKEQGIYPYFPIAHDAPGRIVRMQDGIDCIMLASCDYLGLSNDARMKQAAIEAIQRFGTNICGSIAFSGMTEIHSALQSSLQSFMGTEDAIIFPTSYLANIGAISTIAGPDDLLLMDANNHVSLFQAARLSQAKIRTFSHLNYDVLAGILRRNAGKRRALIITDGLFSADGDYADLRAICQLADTYNALVVVDSAHDLGIHGETGRGLTQEQGVAERVNLIVGTMSKAMGSTGGFVAGRKTLIDRMRHFAGAYHSSRAVSPGVAAASLAALNVVQQEGDARRASLFQNTEHLWCGLKAKGFETSDSASPVIPIYLANAETVLRATKFLQDNGVCVCGMISPSVQVGSERLRLNVTNMLTHDDCDKTIGVFERMATDLSLWSGTPSQTAKP